MANLEIVLTRIPDAKYKNVRTSDNSVTSTDVTSAVRFIARDMRIKRRVKAHLYRSNHETPTTVSVLLKELPYFASKCRKITQTQLSRLITLYLAIIAASKCLYMLRFNLLRNIYTGLSQRNKKFVIQYGNPERCRIFGEAA